MITEKECLQRIKTAIKQFGEYSYYDKGPTEVMDMVEIDSRMKGMNSKQLGDLLASIRRKKYGVEFVREVLCCLQDRKDLDDLYEDERVSDLY